MNNLWNKPPEHTPHHLIFIYFFIYFKLVSIDLSRFLFAISFTLCYCNNKFLFYSSITIIFFTFFSILIWNKIQFLIFFCYFTLYWKPSLTSLFAIFLECVKCKYVIYVKYRNSSARFCSCRSLKWQRTLGVLVQKYMFWLLVSFFAFLAWKNIALLPYHKSHIVAASSQF